MTLSQSLPEKIGKAGISIDDKWEPGDLGLLIHLHGVQNFRDYGFNAMHEAYCAKIAVEFMLNPHRDRSFAWLARRRGEVVGSVLDHRAAGKRSATSTAFCCQIGSRHWFGSLVGRGSGTLFRFARFQADLPLDGCGFGPSYCDLQISRIYAV
jgi:hypothetical protein